jgi:hypothetical protein
LNNNRNTNRRRGRNSNRGPGGGNQGNRIDSRARGNAPQMLEKYKKLAHDASLNGDRVQTEYYLQFADHYFRVMADIKAQKDEQQPRGRRDDRDQDEDGDDENEAEDTSSRREPKRSGRRRDTRDNDNDEGDRGSEGEKASADEEENPFVPESKPRRARRSPRANGAEETSGKDAKDEGGGLDPASLPPAIGAGDKSGDEEARPRRRTRRTREAGGDDGTLEAVG